MNENVLNIATNDVAEKIFQYANMQWYQSMLEALQQEAERLGYVFAKGGDFPVAPLPPIVDDRLAFALTVQRELYLSPTTDKADFENKVREWFAIGFPQRLLKDFLDGLAYNNITIVAGVFVWPVYLRMNAFLRKRRSVMAHGFDWHLICCRRCALMQNT